MHRREVEIIASTIRERRIHHIGVGTLSAANRVAVQTTEMLAKDICKALKAESPHFRDDLFFRACGMSSRAGEI